MLALFVIVSQALMRAVVFYRCPVSKVTPVMTTPADKNHVEEKAEQIDSLGMQL